jgi:hypothetical protein
MEHMRGEGMTKREIAAALRESLRRELLETERLEQCERDTDFIVMLRSIIDDLAALEERADTLLQGFLTQPHPQEGLYTFQVYLERADEPARLIGPISGDTVPEAIEKAAQLYEYPSRDLVVRPMRDQPEEQPIDSNYQPKAGDICVLKLWVGPFSIQKHDGTKWQRETWLTSEQEVTAYVEAMRYMGDGRYYRPQSAGHQS